MSTPTVRVVAHLIARPGQVEALKTLLLSLIEPSRQDAGVIKYELLQNRADPTDFTFIEEWESDEALDTHLASDHLVAAIAQFPVLLARDPDIRRYNSLDIGGCAS